MSEIQELPEEGTGAVGKTPSVTEEALATQSEPPEAPSRPRRPERRPPSFFWPLLLIGAGVILLLSNLGYLPWQSWAMLWRLWPLLLVALGVDLLIGRRSMLGAVLSALLILLLIAGVALVVLFAQNIPPMVQATGSADLRTEHVQYPLAGVERAAVNIDWASGTNTLSALSDSDSLIEGDITHRGRLIFDTATRNSRADIRLGSQFPSFWFEPFGAERGVSERWSVKLSPKVPLDLILDSGSGRCDFDLSGLQLNSLNLDSGSGAITLSLPPGRSFEADINSGSGSIAITLPRDAGAQVELNSGSGSFQPDERFRRVGGSRGRDGTWQTDNYGKADYNITLRIDQGSGSLSLR
jgi:hypothetical protein